MSDFQLNVKAVEILKMQLDHAFASAIFTPQFQEILSIAGISKDMIGNKILLPNEENLAADLQARPEAEQTALRDKGVGMVLHRGLHIGLKNYWLRRWTQSFFNTTIVEV